MQFWHFYTPLHSQFFVFELVVIANHRILRNTTKYIFCVIFFPALKQFQKHCLNTEKSGTSHFSQITKPIAQCLKITQKVAFEFWQFPPFFVTLKLTWLVTLFDRHLQLFKNSPILAIFGIFNDFLWAHNQNVAMLDATFSVIFEHRVTVSYFFAFALLHPILFVHNRILK